MIKMVVTSDRSLIAKPVVNTYRAQSQATWTERVEWVPVSSLSLFSKPENLIYDNHFTTVVYQKYDFISWFTFNWSLALLFKTFSTPSITNEEVVE